MSRWQDVEGVALGSEGFDCNTRRPFDSVKEAKEWLRRVASDRSYWVRLAESETFPEEIAMIALFRGDEQIDEREPNWKGSN